MLGSTAKQTNKKITKHNEVMILYSDVFYTFPTPKCDLLSTVTEPLGAFQKSGI